MNRCESLRISPIAAFENLEKADRVELASLRQLQLERRGRTHTQCPDSDCAILIRVMRFFALLVSTLGLASLLGAQEVPAWCRNQPRPGYSMLRHVPVRDGWFEVYRVDPGVFAIYEPHQSEETIGYLIVGETQALLFDTGMGISDIRSLTSELTRLPVIVINSHTHQDHVGGNWQFQTVYGMDTDFTRHNARGSRDAAQREIAPGELCGTLPPNFDREAYATKAWKITGYKHDGDRLDLGGRTLEILATPGHTPDAICLLDRAHGLLFTGDTYYPGTIYLMAPETDLDAYGASIRTLAALAPKLKAVLGAHNFPVEPPSVLNKLVADFQALLDGKAVAKPGFGTVTYRVNGFSFLLAAPAKN